MAEETPATINRLERQPDPEPPAYAAPGNPSLLLYGCLVIFAFLLTLLGFKLDVTGHLSGFLLNLATEIIGAVIVLALVDRRFRENEIRFIQGIPGTTGSLLSTWFLGESKDLKAYVSILSSQVKLASLPIYFPRPEVEAVLKKNRSKGLILIGVPGMGKTTILHYLIRLQAKDVLKDPRRALVPILVAVNRWVEGETADVLRTTMQDFYQMKDRTFRRLLQKGRLLCVFDGVDEFNSTEVIGKLKSFRTQYPNNVLVISTRPLAVDAFEGLGLEKFEIPPLREEELKALFRMRRQVHSEANPVATASD
ncbi:MAG TPA: NACHT domain-containing protein [Pyrinomonadaceae bacterium]|jgi:hypothetical protein|nr:NACHT domain-containing protein [Pyrinomonadaceae bacterium]